MSEVLWFILVVVAFFFGLILGWLLTLRGGYYCFKLSDSQEQNLSYQEWRDRHLKKFEKKKKVVVDNETDL